MGTEAHVPLADAARVLGTSTRWLQLWCSGDAEHQPPLPHQRRGRLILVQPAAAYEHLARHGRRTAHLRRPDAAAPAAGAQTPALPEADDAASVLDRLARDPAHVVQMGPEAARVMILAAEALRRRGESDARGAALVRPAEAARMVRSVAEAFAWHVQEEGARRLASRLLSVLRTQFGTDLTAVHQQAHQVLVELIQTDANATIAAVRRQADEETRGVPALDFGAREAGEK